MALRSSSNKSPYVFFLCFEASTIMVNSTLLKNQGLKHLKRALLWSLCVMMLSMLSACGGCRGDNNQANGTTGPMACTVGSVDCACDEGDVCGLDGAGQQLACQSGLCKPAPCDAGSAGCACAEGMCDAGLECASTSGVERCEVSGCEVGAEGCGCGLDRGCDAGLSCVSGTCQSLDCEAGSVRGAEKLSCESERG